MDKHLVNAPNLSPKKKIARPRLLIALASLLTVLSFVAIKEWHIGKKNHGTKNQISETPARQLMQEMNAVHDVFADYYDLFVDLHEYTYLTDMETEKLIKQARVSRDYKKVTIAQNELPNMRNKIRELKSSDGQIVLKQHFINAYKSLESISSVGTWSVSDPPDLSELLEVKILFDSYRSDLSDADLLTPK